MITQEYLKECLDYNEKAGTFTWAVRPLHHYSSRQEQEKSNRRRAGKPPVTLSNGYFQVCLDGKKYLLHRLAYLYFHGYIPNLVGHDDGVKTNNSRENLKDLSVTENAKNRKLNKNSSSGILGVSWNQQTSSWKVQIVVKGKKIFLGYYKTKTEARAARLAADNKYGYHKLHGSK